MKVAVVGVTGVVGTVMLNLLDKRKFPITQIIPVASEKSVGKKIGYQICFLHKENGEYFSGY